MQSAGKAAVVEKGLFLRRRGAAQDRVAMRESPEAANDTGMALGVFAELIIAVAARQLKAAFLIRQVFRVHERQIEELALGMRDLPVEAAADCALGDAAGELVGRVRVPVVAKHVARKLVERDDERERAFRGLLPVRQLTRAGGVPEREKAPPDVEIEVRALLEPFVGSGRAPECEHVGRADRGCAGRGAAGHRRSSPELIRSYSAGSTRTNAWRCASLK